MEKHKGRKREHEEGERAGGSVEIFSLVGWLLGERWKERNKERDKGKDSKE